MNEDRFQEIATRLGVPVEEVRNIAEAARLRHAVEEGHRQHEDAEAESARARVHHR